MFGKKQAKNNQFAAGGHTLFDHALEVRGTVKFGGNLDIEGTVIGDVEADPSSEARVRITDRGTVEGQISAPKVIVNGTVKGNIYASKHLELAANACVTGDVHYRVIEMVKGSQVNGNMVLISDTETASADEEVKPSITEDVSPRNSDSSL